MRGATSEAGSDLGVGTNFSPRERTEVSAAERGWSERLMTVFVELSLVIGLIEARGPWKVGLGNGYVEGEEGGVG